jgi:predicted DsbA family dithiol-disulfide isomerase
MTGGPDSVAAGMKVEIWSDVVCPWCYIGKRRFEAALARFEHAADVEVVWRAFELDPTSPVEVTGDYAERIGVKYGTSTEQAQGMVDNMTAVAAQEGLDFRFDLARTGNTFDAHRLLHLAGERGVQDAVKERLLKATFSEGEPIGDHATLVRLVGEAGLATDEARDLLASDRYAAQVREDEQQAHQIGVTGVPFFVIDRKYGVSGAQPVDLLLQALQQAWAERTPVLSVLSPGAATGPGCVGDSCSV